MCIEWSSFGNFFIITFYIQNFQDICFLLPWNIFYLQVGYNGSKYYRMWHIKTLPKPSKYKTYPFALYIKVKLFMWVIGNQWVTKFHNVNIWNSNGTLRSIRNVKQNSDWNSSICRKNHRLEELTWLVFDNFFSSNNVLNACDRMNASKRTASSLFLLTTLETKRW